MKYSGIAQLVEQLTVNQFVGGSSPSSGARIKKRFPILWKPFFVYIMYYIVFWIYLLCLFTVWIRIWIGIWIWIRRGDVPVARPIMNLYFISTLTFWTFHCPLVKHSVGYSFFYVFRLPWSDRFPRSDHWTTRQSRKTKRSTS